MDSLPVIAPRRAAKDAAGARGTALVVDADPDRLERMRLMLDQLGFRTLVAADGEQAVRLFERSRPGIAFVEIDLPGMDGIATTRLLKASAGPDFVPVIVLTNLRDDSLILRCAEAGGDDFLSRPISPAILEARIFAMERMRDLQRTVAAKQQALSDLVEREREEQALAERVLDRAVKSRNVAMDHLGLVQRPATVFNGDLVLAQYLPDGGLRILVGDFTGHGLAAAVGALPVADAFHAMTRKGMNDLLVLAEINRKLYHLLPADRFMAAYLVSIPGNGEELRWWNGGMPSGWLRTRTGLQQLAPHALPLGILPELPAQEAPRRIRLHRGDRLLLMSDGLLEACDRSGRMFIDAGFETLVNDWEFARPLLPDLMGALDRHCAGAEQTDDIAALEIPLDPVLFAKQDYPSAASAGSGWRWSLELQDERLCNQPTIESALRSLGLLDGLDKHLCVLETILAELFTNALEHGVLQLESGMKESPNGFDAYYRERAQRLADGWGGRVGISLAYEPEGEGGCLRMLVTDSGDGFSEADIAGLSLDSNRVWGRGIPLVRHLSHAVTYLGKGSQVEVVYRW